MDAAKIARHGAEIAKGIDENNTAKTVFNSLGLGFELGKIFQNNNDSHQSHFDTFIHECKLAAGANNPFVVSMERQFANVNEQQLEDELQRIINAIEVYLISNGLSTDVPLLNLFKSRYGIPIRLSDFDNGFEIVKQIDIHNIRRANAAQPPEFLAKILYDYQIFINHMLKKLKDELALRGQIII